MKRWPQAHGLALLGNWAELLSVSRAVPVGTSQTRNWFGWKEAVVSLLFPFLSLVWFGWNSHSLEVVSLLWSFSFPSSSIPKTSSQSPGALVLGWTCRAWRTPLCSHTKIHSFPPVYPLHPFLLKGFAASHPWAQCFSSQETWAQLSHEARGRSKVISDLQAEGVGLWLSFFLFLLI